MIDSSLSRGMHIPTIRRIVAPNHSDLPDGMLVRRFMLLDGCVKSPRSTRKTKPWPKSAFLGSKRIPGWDQNASMAIRDLLANALEARSPRSRRSTL